VLHWLYASAVDWPASQATATVCAACRRQGASTSGSCIRWVLIDSWHPLPAIQRKSAASGGCSLTLGTHYLRYSGKVLAAWALKCRHFQQPRPHGVLFGSRWRLRSLFFPDAASNPRLLERHALPILQMPAKSRRFRKKFRRRFRRWFRRKFRRFRRRLVMFSRQWGIEWCHPRRSMVSMPLPTRRQMVPACRSCLMIKRGGAKSLMRRPDQLLSCHGSVTARDVRPLQGLPCVRACGGIRTVHFVRIRWSFQRQLHPRRGPCAAQGSSTMASQVRRCSMAGWRNRVRDG
jgi:hypothetical protein